jgi:hypothetical protein
MDQPPLTLLDQAIPRRRGRPPGARNRRSIDLARYIEAVFAGSTPGQQAAQLAMVSAKELRTAPARARELGIVHPPRDPLMLAMVVKAEELARGLGCERKEAWLLLQKEREGLMAYVHSKQGPATPPKPGEKTVAFVIPEGLEGPAPTLDLGEDDGLEIIDGFSEPSRQVPDPKSPADP